MYVLTGFRSGSQGTTAYILFLIRQVSATSASRIVSDAIRITANMMFSIFMMSDRWLLNCGIISVLMIRLMAEEKYSLLMMRT